MIITFLKRAFVSLSLTYLVLFITKYRTEQIQKRGNYDKTISTDIGSVVVACGPKKPVEEAAAPAEAPAAEKKQHLQPKKHQQKMLLKRLLWSELGLGLVLQVRVAMEVLTS